MRERRVDVAIIGAGTAGLAARREVAARGADYALIERGPYGTTCARVGCMPSKLLIAAADAAQHARDAGVFGVVVPEVTIDGRAVMNRVRRERDRFVGFVLEGTSALSAENRIDGNARFVGPNELLVDEHTRVIARATVIATGSTPLVPPSLDRVRDRVMTSDDVFEMSDLPKSMLVLGTGIIGLELGQAFARLGVRVAFLSISDELGPLSDPALRVKALALYGRGLDLHLSATNIEIEPRGEHGVTARWRDAHGEHDESYDTVLVAIGRRPNLAALDLDAANVTLDARGMPSFDRNTMQIEGAPIFLAGDVDADRPLLHEAADEGRIAGSNAATYPKIEPQPRTTPLAIMFTTPQIATVGKAQRELDAASIVVGEVSYDDQGRARVMNEHHGLVHLYADKRSGELLGAEMLGPRVEHTAHLLAWAIEQRLTIARMLQMPFYHPVFEEGIRTALRDAAGKLDIIAETEPIQLDCAPGS